MPPEESIREERLRICSSPGTRTWMEPSRNQAPVSRALARQAASIAWLSSVWAFSSVSVRLAPIRPVFSGVMMKSAPAPRASRACSRTNATFSTISLLTLVWIRPALNAVAIGDAPSARVGEQRVELARLLEGGKLVGTADIPAVDEDLRHRRALGALAHLGPLLLVHHHVHSLVGRALLLEQVFGPRAVAAEGRRVHLDLGHREPLWRTIPPGGRPAPASAHQHGEPRRAAKRGCRPRPSPQSSARRRPAARFCRQPRSPSAGGCRRPAGHCPAVPGRAARSASLSIAAAEANRGPAEVACRRRPRARRRAPATAPDCSGV